MLLGMVVFEKWAEEQGGSGREIYHHKWCTVSAISSQQWHANFNDIIDTYKTHLTGGNWQKWKRVFPDMSLP